MNVLSGVEIRGMSGVVPSAYHKIDEYGLLTPKERAKLKQATGIEGRRIVRPGVTTTDMCGIAAHELMIKLGWDPGSVNLVVLVTQSPDYPLPASAIVLQHQLGLPKTAVAFDVNLGCSAFPYGYAICASQMQALGFKRALLLMGDTVSRLCNPCDRSTYPLFGDAGTATALELSADSSPAHLVFGSDGSGKDAIIVRTGTLSGRSPVTAAGLTPQEHAPGIVHSDAEVSLDGAAVFSFAISKAPSAVMEVLDHAFWSVEDLDVLVLHQANKMINDIIARKLKIPTEKIPSTLRDFGNTSSASIPLTIVANPNLFAESRKVVLCGFGVGLSWSALACTLKQPELLLIESDDTMEEHLAQMEMK